MMNVLKRVAASALVLAMTLAAAGLARAQSPKPLSEADLLKLIELQIDDNVVAAKLGAAGVSFAVTDALVERLKKAGASDAVVAAVRKVKEVKQPAAAANAVTYQDVLKLLELGIGEADILKRLEKSPTTFVLDARQAEELAKAGATDRLLAAMRGLRGSDGKAARLTDLAVILDCSGSMSEKTSDGHAKMKVAKEVVTELVRKLPNGLNVTFLVYGHDAALKCQAVKVVRPLGKLDDEGKSELTKFIATLEPAGHTPIALALQMAGKELAKKPDASCGLVLITDGMETCRGNPAEEAARLAKDLNLTFGVNVIGFDVNDPKERQAVEEIAKAGKGTYYNADSAAKLTTIVQALGEEVVKKVDAAPAQRPDRPVDLGGKDTKPGAFVNDAPVVAPGEYKGSLPLMGADYRQVAVRKGQELRAVGIVQKTPYQASNSVINETFSITVYDSNLAVVARETMNVEGNPSAVSTFRATWTAPSDGMAYIAIAASDNHDGRGDPVALYGDLNPKPSPYTLVIKVAGTAAESGAPQAVARSGAKAGNGFARAGELSVPGLAGADLKLGEVLFYRLTVKKGDVVQASAAFAKPWYRAGNGNIKATYTLTLYDDDQVQVAQKKVEVGLNPPDARALTITAPVLLSGNAYLSLSCENTGSSIYPDDFKPKPGRVAVQVTGAKADAPAGPVKGPKFDGN